MKYVLVLLLALSGQAFAKKPEGDKGKECKKAIQAQIKVLKKQMKACKGAPVPEPVPEEPELPEEPVE
jgi:hypothetical protein